MSFEISMQILKIKEKNHFIKSSLLVIGLQLKNNNRVKLKIETVFIFILFYC